VLVVGAGPTGAVVATAFLQAHPGLSVALLDKATFPRDKPCGDAVSPGAVETLKQLGLASVFDGYPSNPAYAVRGPRGTEVAGAALSLDGAALRGYVIPRAVFDARLVDEAVGAGVTLFPRHTFASTSLEDGARVAVAKSPDGPVRFRARLLVGADGAYSRVRAALGVPAQPRAATGVAVRAYVEHDEDGALPPIRFEFARTLLPAYAWLFPVRPGLSNVGVGLPAADLRRRGGGRFLTAALDEYLRLARSRGLRLSPARDRATHLLPHAGSIPRMAHPRAVLLGDAAALINPFSGEGIHYGIRGATRAVEMAGQHLGDPARLNQALRDFEQDLRRRLGAHYRSALLAQRLVRSRRLAQLLVDLAEVDETFLLRTIRLLFGEGRVDNRLVRSVMVGGARVLARPRR
jgi:menaquinone-9 beta-reductase